MSIDIDYNSLVGKAVRHDVYGAGVITEVRQRRYPEAVMTIDFSGDEKKFIYPGAFESFLASDDIEMTENAMVALYAMRGLEYRPNYEKKKEKPKRARSPKLPPGEERTNIAFKCNYNDGGKDSTRIGFCGVCSDEMIDINIHKETRAKCMGASCPCMRYLNKEITRKELDSHTKDKGFICYESMMLRDWKAMVGLFTSGEKRGEPMRLRNISKKSLAMLTTKLPHESESDRLVFAVFMVDIYFDGEGKEESYVACDSKYRLSFSGEERLMFWNYHANDNNPSRRVWSSGLFRYTGSDECVQLLRDAAEIKKGTRDEALAREFLEYYCEVNGIDESKVGPPFGALRRKPE